MNYTALSPEASRWARRLLSLSQKDLSQQAGISLSYLKQYEVGRFSPPEDFLKRLANFLESKDVDLSQFDESAVVDPAPVEPGKPRKVRRMGFYISDALDAGQVEDLFERIEENQKRIEELRDTKLVSGFWGGNSEESGEQLKELYSRLVLDSLLFRALLGTSPVEPQRLGDRKATILADHLADFFASNLGMQEPESGSASAEKAA